eukprot:Nitzschia sp. Nitz4//scaffold54_size114964//101688//102230//NITZ4_003870-RA/size114964-processed-gene-0.194-mRNA-1//-1//CDS//3329554408//2224//frame0
MSSEGTGDSSSNTPRSALQDNIESKGKNAYYFAHAHKANGPKWDGKPEPKLLNTSVSSGDDDTEAKKAVSSFEYHKSNITSYAFSDETKSVKLYITLEDIGEKCTPADVSLDFTPRSFCLVVNNYVEGEEKCLSFGRLTAAIKDAQFKIKKDKIILTLKKEEESEWHSINDKGTPDHEVV